MPGIPGMPEEIPWMKILAALAVVVVLYATGVLDSLFGKKVETPAPEATATTTTTTTSVDRANIANISERATPTQEQQQLTESLQNQLGAAASLESAAEEQLSGMEPGTASYEDALANYDAAQEAADDAQNELEDVQESYTCPLSSDGRNQYPDDNRNCRPCTVIPHMRNGNRVNCTTGSDQVISYLQDGTKYCEDKYYYQSPDDDDNTNSYGRCLVVNDTGNQPWGGGSGEPCTTGRDYWETMYTPTSPGDCRTCPSSKYFNATNRTCNNKIGGGLNHPCGTGSPQNKCNAGFECNEQYVPSESVCKIALYNAGGGICDVNADCIGKDPAWGTGPGLNRDCSAATTMSGDRCVD